MSETTAGLRGEAARVWDELSGITPADVTADTESAAPGWTMWRAGRAFVCLPTMLRDAPEDAHARYWLRIRAGLTGACPVCGEVAGLTADPGTAAFWALPVTVRLVHHAECPATFTDADQPLFDGRAWS